MITTDPNHPDLKRGVDTEKVPQNKAYLVLSEEERAKGFIRPLRCSYVHKGRLYDKGLELLKVPETINGKTYHAIATVLANEDGSRKGGSYLTKDEVDQYNQNSGYVGGCGTLTTMAKPIAETYARDPNFYGATYCCGCQRHIGVHEFVWDGTNELVGS